MRTFRLLLILLFLSLSANLGAIDIPDIELSEKSRVSLLTCGPGEELYSTFGHSAIRLSDPAHGDIVFNYGTFSFNQPNFYLRFAQGRLLYRLSVQSYSGFRDYYISTGR